jgi:hypothetical protein
MAEKKKPKPGPSTGGSSTSRIKRPKGSQPLTLGTGGLRTGKVSKKQQAGTRKVVGALAAATPVGRAAKTANVLGGKAVSAVVRKTNPGYAPGFSAFNKGIGKNISEGKAIRTRRKADAKETRLSGAGAPKQPKYPSNVKSVKNKPSKTVGLETRGKKATVTETSDRARYLLYTEGIKGKKRDASVLKAANRVKTTGTPQFSRGVSEAREGLAKLHGVKTKDMKMAKAIRKANKRALKSVNKKK